MNETGFLTTLLTDAATDIGLIFVKHSIREFNIWRQNPLLSLGKKAKNTAEGRVKSFLSELQPLLKTAERIARLSRRDVDSAFSKPEIVDVINTSLASAAETDSSLVRTILANLVFQRLLAADGSRLTMTLRSAVAAIRSITEAQLKQLGLQFAFVNCSPSKPPANASPDEAFEKMTAEIEHDLRPFKDVDYNNLDLRHLETQSLVRISRVAAKLGIRFGGEEYTNAPIISSLLMEYSPERVYGNTIVKDIESRFRSEAVSGKIGGQSVFLTVPLGYVIGLSVFCVLHKQTLDLSGLNQ